MKKLFLTILALFFSLPALAETFSVTDYCTALQQTTFTVPKPAGATEVLVRETDTMAWNITFTTNASCPVWYHWQHNFSIKASFGSSSATQQSETTHIDGEEIVPNTTLTVGGQDKIRGGIRFPLSEESGSVVNLTTWSTLLAGEGGNCGELGVSTSAMCTKTLNVNFR